METPRVSYFSKGSERIEELFFWHLRANPPIPSEDPHIGEWVAEYVYMRTAREAFGIEDRTWKPRVHTVTDNETDRQTDRVIDRFMPARTSSGRGQTYDLGDVRQLPNGV